MKRFVGIQHRLPVRHGYYDAVTEILLCIQNGRLVYPGLKDHDIR